MQHHLGLDTSWILIHSSGTPSILYFPAFTSVPPYLNKNSFIPALSTEFRSTLINTHPLLHITHPPVHHHVLCHGHGTTHHQHSAHYNCHHHNLHKHHESHTHHGLSISWNHLKNHHVILRSSSNADSFSASSPPSESPFPSASSSQRSSRLDFLLDDGESSHISKKKPDSAKRDPAKSESAFTNKKGSSSTTSDSDSANGNFARLNNNRESTSHSRMKYNINNGTTNGSVSENPRNQSRSDTFADSPPMSRFTVGPNDRQLQNTLNNNNSSVLDPFDSNTSSDPPIASFRNRQEGTPFSPKQWSSVDTPPAKPTMSLASFLDEEDDSNPNDESDFFSFLRNSRLSSRLFPASSMSSLRQSLSAFNLDDDDEGSFTFIHISPSVRAPTTPDSQKKPFQPWKSTSPFSSAQDGDDQKKQKISYSQKQQQEQQKFPFTFSDDEDTQDLDFLLHKSLSNFSNQNHTIKKSFSSDLEQDGQDQDDPDLFNFFQDPNKNGSTFSSPSKAAPMNLRPTGIAKALQTDIQQQNQTASSPSSSSSHKTSFNFSLGLTDEDDADLSFLTGSNIDQAQRNSDNSQDPPQDITQNQSIQLSSKDDLNSKLKDQFSLNFMDNIPDARNRAGKLNSRPRARTSASDQDFDFDFEEEPISNDVERILNPSLVNDNKKLVDTGKLLQEINELSFMENAYNEDDVVNGSQNSPPENIEDTFAPEDEEDYAQFEKENDDPIYGQINKASRRFDNRLESDQDDLSDTEVDTSTNKAQPTESDDRYLFKIVNSDLFVSNLNRVEAAHIKRAENVVKLLRDIQEPTPQDYLIAINECCTAQQWKPAYTLLKEMCTKDMNPSFLIYNKCIRACERNGRWKPALKIFELMTTNGLVPGLTTFNAVMKVMQESNISRLVFNWMDKMENDHNVKPDINTYKIALKVCRAQKKSYRAHLLFFKMLDENITPDTECFLYVMSALARRGYSQKVLDHLDRMKKFNLKPTHDIIHNCMIACRISKTPNFLNRLLEDMEYNYGLVPTLETYNICISTYAKDGDVRRVDYILKEMKRHDVQPNLFTYNCILSIYSLNREGFSAYNLLSEMKQRRMPLDTRTYNLVMEACKSRKYRAKVLKLKEEMQIYHIPADIDTYNLCLVACRMAGDVEMTVKLLKEMRSNGIRISINTYNNALSVFSKRGQVEAAEKLFSILRSENLLPNVITYNSLLFCYESARNDKKAMQLFDEMKAKNIQPNALTYGSLASLHEKVGKWKTALKLIKEMMENGLQCSVFIYITSLFACERGGLVDKANELINIIAESGKYLSFETYSYLIGICEQTGRADRAVWYLSQMEKDKLKPPFNFYETVISLCREKGMNEEAEALKSKLETRNPLRDAWSYSMFISSLRKSGDWEKALETLESMKKQKITPNAVTYVSCISVCEKANRWKECVELLREMQENNMSPDIVAYSCCISSCARAKNKNLAMELFLEMRKYGLLPNLISYVSCIEVHAALGDWETSVGLLKQMKLDGVQPNLTVYNSCIEAYTKAGLWKKAMKMVDEMIANGVDPDSTSYNLCISACETAGRTDLVSKLKEVAAEKVGAEEVGEVVVN